ncbi:hypothetical protein TWF694_005705 [Orbilia ellipsospora]|uniref:Nucleoside phosphorylase domain-containing protein n=1 Tax=Orbilia ellipsospora TaxID=2528407 RepID=A0AAV9WS07_9PEZI
MSTSDLPQKQHSDYGVGWVCALPKEQTVAAAMLDQKHADLQKLANDKNTYTLGSIAGHNVVIACLPKDRDSTVSAASVATRMVHTFPAIKFILMVGIGRGVPPKVRLGDVVVSTPTGQFSGVVEWDIGRTTDGKFERTGALNSPPTLLLTALSKLETMNDIQGSKVEYYLQEMGERHPRLRQKYLNMDLKDVLYKAAYSHINKRPEGVLADGDEEGNEEEDESCRWCNPEQVVERRPPTRGMKVHYGLIASGDHVIKDSKLRKQLNDDLGGQVLCIDTEAAGIMNDHPCIVVRGICDYADSHNNKAWEGRAAAVAAAFAKELLTYIQPSDIEKERPAKDIVNES